MKAVRLWKNSAIDIDSTIMQQVANRSERFLYNQTLTSGTRTRLRMTRHSAMTGVIASIVRRQAIAIETNPSIERK